MSINALRTNTQLWQHTITSSTYCWTEETNLSRDVLKHLFSPVFTTWNNMKSSHYVNFISVVFVKLLALYPVGWIMLNRFSGCSNTCRALIIIQEMMSHCPHTLYIYNIHIECKHHGQTG